ncbi:uncharacterized protein BO80DRAFT_239447 [Aspergillus ibericus CBS 121593]|uniref:BTB domain transcription factor n=1 Tax=Aspergillus ibericus CBS 121593 TaxID=1448316 RepID=A0A395GMU3_9EURO|nr:BTB domain transcription factor [Aspergillus ibericus CBS 121593]RAK96157.1 BTB domain transcription factor [Aspergillus ibericus CBS 121593]
MTEVLGKGVPPVIVQPHDESGTFTFQPSSCQSSPGIPSGASTAPPEEDPLSSSRVEGGGDVVQPYAIEEPEDDPIEFTSRPAGKPVIHLYLGDNSDIWQGELVDSMEDLYCNSDHANRQWSTNHKRGKKRRPSATVAGSYRLYRQPSYGAASDNQYDWSIDTTKRRRRKGRCSREQFTSPPGTFWQHEAKDTGSSDSSSSRSPSTDAIESHPGYSGPDTMEIDG